MSDQQHKKAKSNPLEGLGGSPLFSSPAPLPQLPSIPQITPVSQPEPQQAPLPQHTEQAPMLWNTSASPQLILRDFVQRHDKQAVYVDVRYAGAMAALAKLLHKGNKTELINEMIEDLLQKHSQLLRDNEELVRILEEGVRKKHHID